MKIDRTFSNEVAKAANGDGSREARFTFLRSAKQAALELSTPRVRDLLPAAVKAYGRSTIGICVAVTVLERQDRLDASTVRWAQEVMKLWTNRPNSYSCLAIKDNLHPTRIEEYAGGLIRLTTEEA